MKHKLLFLIFSLCQTVCFAYNSCLIFRYEYPEGSIQRFSSIHGYQYANVFESESQFYFECKLVNDSCIQTLISRANELEKETAVPTYYKGFDVHKQLILEKEGYGYDVLDFAYLQDGSYKIEMNGKLMKHDKRWDLFINLLIQYHQKYKKITNSQFREILAKSGMLNN